MSGRVHPPAIRRIVAIGSESTGKTELIEWLARELAAPASAEFAREYAEAHGGAAALTAADVEPIARGQLALEEAAIAAARSGGGSLVLHDTDLLSTLVYARAYYGAPAVPRWLPGAVAERRPTLYLLCDIDVPWHSDAVRDAEADREGMQRRFVEALAAQPVPCVEIRGSGPERRRVAMRAVNG